MHTHGPVVHDGLRGWRVLDNGSVREFTLAHACSEPGDEREIRGGRLYFHDLFAGWDAHGVRVPPDVEFHLALLTGELLRTPEGWRWVSASGWTHEVTLPTNPVASANGFLLVRENGGLRTLAFEPPMCQHADWRADLAGAEDMLLHRSVVWDGATARELAHVRIPYYVTAHVRETGVHFTNARSQSAGTSARAAALRVGQTEVVANDTATPTRPSEAGTNWTTWRVRGGKRHKLCADACDTALACAVVTGPARAATHKQMFCGFLVCVYGLEGCTVPTQLAIQYLARVVYFHFQTHAEPAALAWMAFILLQEKRDLRIRRLVGRMQPAADATGFSDVQAGSDEFWGVVEEYQRAWPLSNEFSASFALAIGAPRDPQQHSLYLPVEPHVNAWGIPLSADNDPGINCIETGIGVYQLRREAEAAKRRAMVRNHAFPWSNTRLRHRLLRTVAVCAALHLFRYPTWLRIMELYWTIDVQTRRALVFVPLQTARYAWPKDAALLHRVEEELWAFFRAAYAIYRGLEKDLTTRNDENKGTSSLSIAMHVRKELESRAFTRVEYRLAVAPLFAAESNPRASLEKVFPDRSLWDRRDRLLHESCRTGWCRSRAEADIEAVRDAEEQQALIEGLRAPPIDHPAGLTWNTMTVALGMNQQPMFKRVARTSDPGFFNYEDRLLLVLPSMVHDTHVPATSLPPFWSI